VASAFTGRLGIALLSALLSGCWRTASSTNEFDVRWTVQPPTATAGASTRTRIALHDDQQQPVHGARLQLEAHMSHPGMAPVVRRLTETDPGVYEADVQFSMAGDWVLVVTGTLADGRTITRQLPMPGVRPAG
jgi:hypothetical protein